MQFKFNLEEASNKKYLQFMRRKLFCMKISGVRLADSDSYKVVILSSSKYKMDTTANLHDKNFNF